MMPNMTILMSNVAAAVNKTTLSRRDLKLLQQYAQETRSDYCAGCAQICEICLDRQVPIGDIMRYLMYARGYGDQENAKALFRKIPREIRTRISALDYSRAEQKCPQQMEIGRLMREAAIELA